MELKINLATASLKDAEHAIFLIGAYFGMTNLPTVAEPVAVRLPGAVAAAVVANPQGVAQALQTAVADGTAADAAAAFGAHPAGPLPPEPQPDPAQVFGGNVATAPVMPSPPATVAASAPTVVAPAVGDVGNVAPSVAGAVGSPPAGTLAPAPSPFVAPAGVELDATGLPWDARIHASGEGGAKPKNADGKWRKKRGLNDGTFVGQVEAELRATLAAPGPGAQPQPPAPPVAPPAPPAPPSADPQTFEQLMPRITAAVMGGTLPQSALLQAVTAYQLPNIPALAQRPDLVGTIWAYLRSMYPALA